MVIPVLFVEHPAWLGTCGQWLIIERAIGLVVGGIGLFLPPDDGNSKSTRALTKFALAAPEAHTVIVTVDLANPASARVLEKAAFNLAGQSRGTGGECLACYRAVAEQR